MTSITDEQQNNISPQVLVLRQELPYVKGHAALLQSRRLLIIEKKIDALKRVPELAAHYNFKKGHIFF